MKKSQNISELIIYQTEDGQTKLEVQLENETVWLSQNQMAELFDTSKKNVSLHIKNAINEGEFDVNSVVKDSLTTASDGKAYPTNFYNLDVIISVGYRVKSLRGVQFRKWATERLREYITKGFAMNDEFLKNNGGGTYWKELLERIRDIRLSEKVLYRQVLDLYGTSVDYDPRTESSLEFFKTVQNKLHFATHGNTAAEVIYERADAQKPFMGLTTFKGTNPNRREVQIAKNYLEEDELFRLRRYVSAFFDLAEMKAAEHIPMYMADWINELDDFLGRYGKGVLQDAGSISHEQAVQKALGEYEKYKAIAAANLSAVELDYFKLLEAEQKKIGNFDFAKKGPADPPQALNR
jgi:hypothetical protein